MFRVLVRWENLEVSRDVGSSKNSSRSREENGEDGEEAFSIAVVREKVRLQHLTCKKM